MVHLLKHHPWKNYVIVALAVALVSMWAPTQASFSPSIIKNRCQNNIALNDGVVSNTFNISASCGFTVTTSKTVLFYTGLTSTTHITEAQLTLTDSTTITATRANSTGDNNIGFILVEFF